MYSNNKATSSFDNNAITVTPIKVEVDMSPAYPTPSSSGSSVAVAATTSGRRPSTATNNPQLSNSNNAIPSYTISTTSSAVDPSIRGGATSKEKPPKQPRPLTARKPPPTLDTFWPNILAEVRNIQQVDAKHQALPLARIKKIMKLDENAKMIAAEAPLLFAKACEYFIQELTMRAWIHTEESKRRTLQRSDIAQAIANYDQFDFLIDIVPREDIKPSTSSHKKETQPPAATNTTTTTVGAGVSGGPTAVMTAGGLIKVEQTGGGEVLSFGSLTADSLAANTQQPQQQHTQPLQQQQQLQIIQQPTGHQQQMQYFIATPDTLSAPHNQQAPASQQQLQIIQQPAQPQYFITTHQQPQQLILTAGPNGQLTATPAPSGTAQQQQTTLLQNFAQQQHQQQQQQIQLLQQVVTPTGELTNVPIAINANQLNLLRLQMQPAAQQLLHLSSAANNPTPATAHAVQTVQQQQQHPQQQHPQQHNTNIFLNTAQHGQQQSGNHSIVSTDRNLGSTYRPNC